MNRVGASALAGVAGVLIAAAAVVSPRAMQPAGAKAEFTRLMARAVEELDSLMPEAFDDDETSSDPAEAGGMLAAGDVGHAADGAAAAACVPVLQPVETAARCEEVAGSVIFSMDLSPRAIAVREASETFSYVRVVRLTGQGMKSEKDAACVFRWEGLKRS